MYLNFKAFFEHVKRQNVIADVIVRAALKAPTRPRDTEGTPALIGNHTFNPDDKAGVRFYCGAEFSIDEHDRVVSRVPCTLAMRNAVEEIESEGELLFDEQGEAA